MSDTAEKQACSAFRKMFGQEPRWVASAPGRVNLIGEFTDFNGGFVLPMAIEQRTAIAAAPNDMDVIVLHSCETGDSVVLEPRESLIPEAKGRWSNYPKGVLAGFIGRGHVPRGFNAVISSTVPVGAGLSSSAALESSMALLLEQVCGTALEPLTKALLCQRAEHTYAQVPCGLMDQYICLMGRVGEVLLLDCQSNTPSWIPWTDPDVTVVVVNTQVKHELSNSEYALRRAACESAARQMELSSLREADLDLLKSCETGMEDRSIRCARHIITENHRTRQAAVCIRDRDWVSLGGLMYDSHASLRHDYQVSCRELDWVVDLAREMGAGEGVYGSRMTGGGFGGCAIVLVKTEAQGEVIRQIQTGYRQAFDITPAVFASRPCGGATSRQL